MNEYLILLKELLSNPDKLRSKRPFTRGVDRDLTPPLPPSIEVGKKIIAYLPTTSYKCVSQEQFLRELDPNSHDVLYDENIPSICVKTSDNNYRDIKYHKMACPIQREILNKQVMHLSANKMQFTLVDINPTDLQQENYILFKQYWDLRNQDGMKSKMVYTQLATGDAGLLYYFDRFGRIKSRILSYEDGFVLCPHNDQNGDRILESVYYISDGVEYIDSYDDTFMYRYKRGLNINAGEVPTNEDNQWVWEEPKKHGFQEIPLITKRGDVAWNNVQTDIESYEVLYNVFNAIQKRWGWGIFYIKGKFKDDGKKIAGNVVLNDTSYDGKGDAKFLTPPSPQGTIDTLNLILETIQLGSSTTFLLPKDVKMSGDISGIAIMLTQSLDIENATQKVIEWQNVADKMVRLFKFGLSKELVFNGIKPNAITEFENLNISAKFKVWRPLNSSEYNQMLVQMVGAGILSTESGIELNTESKPDEKVRIKKQLEAQQLWELKQENINNQITKE